jgi:preprotein translocase SecE subunit
MNILVFLGEVKAELQKVIWPTKSETFKYTLTVIAFSVGVALVLGAADYGLFRLFSQIIEK